MFIHDFSDKVLVATGAASGMGLLTCQKFCELGGAAVLTDINEEALDAAVKSITERGGKAIGVLCDVRKYDEVMAACKAAKDTFGSLDVVLNTAGGAEMRMLNQTGRFFEVPIEVFDWGIDVNLKGQLYFCHAAMKIMSEQKSGVIINLGSITGLEGSPTNIAYSTAKSAAMNGLTKSVAQAGAPYDVRCVCVAPGPVLTRPGMANMRTAVGFAAEPIEIVEMFLYLASPMARSVTGTTILMDGGRSIMFDKYNGDFGKYKN